MSKLTLDAALLSRLRGVTDRTELCDESGASVGVFTPALAGPFGYNDFLADELDRRSQESEEFTTAEILDTLTRSGKT